MFESLPLVGRELQGEILKLYWLLIIPYILVLIVIEFLKDSENGPDVKRIIKRAVISMILLFSFEMVLDAVSMIGDGICDRIGGTEKLWEVIKSLGPKQESSSGEWFNLRETFIYIFNLAAYIVAYLGFFVATALIHFVWTILYICSPLMILMYVSESTSFVTKNLYKGIISVITWRILWSILGALLLKMATEPNLNGTDNFLTTIIVNLFIGISMLFIPIATKSLIQDGLGSAASMLAAAPAFAATGAIKARMAGFGKKAWQKSVDGSRFLAKPITNPISGKYDVLKNKLGPRMSKMKKAYSEINLTKDAMDLRQIKLNNQRRNFARNQKR